MIPPATTPKSTARPSVTNTFFPVRPVFCDPVVDSDPAVAGNTYNFHTFSDRSPDRSAYSVPGWSRNFRSDMLRHSAYSGCSDRFQHSPSCHSDSPRLPVRKNGYSLSLLLYGFHLPAVPSLRYSVHWLLSLSGSAYLRFH